MERRLVGMVVLTAAFVLTVSLPTVLEPALRPTAIAAAMPLPPPAGACLAGTPLTVVPCQQSHLAEVTRSWAADNPNRITNSQPANCQALAFEYVGLTVVGRSMMWQPMLAQRTAVLNASPTERIGTRGWSACIVAARSEGSIVGSVRNLGAAPASRPAALGWCETSVRADGQVGVEAQAASAPPTGSPTDGQTQVVSCDVPHSTEMLSETLGFAEYLVSDPDLSTAWRDGCHDLAVAVTGSPDPTFRGQASIALVTSTADPDSGFEGVSEIRFGRCALQVDGGRRLIGSVFGLGNAPLPLV